MAPHGLQWKTFPIPRRNLRRLRQHKSSFLLARDQKVSGVAPRGIAVCGGVERVKT